MAKIKNEWSGIIPNAILFIVVLMGAFYTLCSSYGICRQPNFQVLGIQKEQSSQVSEPTPVKTDAITETATAITKPIRMLISSVGLGLNIDDATINVDTNEWPLSDTTAQYANFTPGLGSKRGTLLLYGHATLPVLQKTINLTIGDELILIDENNQSWRFRFVKKEDVFPENVGFIYEDVPFRVVMFTCEGWNNMYRRLMFFDSIE